MSESELRERLTRRISRSARTEESSESVPLHRTAVRVGWPDSYSG